MRREFGGGPIARQRDPDMVTVGVCRIDMSCEYSGGQLLSRCCFGSDGADNRVDAAVLQPSRDKRDHERSRDRKSTRLNSSHQIISYAVFCLKKKKKQKTRHAYTAPIYIDWSS